MPVNTHAIARLADAQSVMRIVTVCHTLLTRNSLLHAQAVPAAVCRQYPLLSCLSQLNDGVFSSYLLPKLKEQGSAGAVALTCSQLRRLCQSSTHHLDLSAQTLAVAPQDSPCNNPALAQQLIAAFPQCTSLKVTWDSSGVDAVHKHISTLLKG